MAEQICSTTPEAWPLPSPMWSAMVREFFAEDALQVSFQNDRIAEQQ
jgi:hypothetical protein